ncbi:hypothetical protein [Citromicrobium sp. JLT1363]|uniref:hypothetical protein n=1 Tax=Citromicrobium sp. JLT1363 TaxID=517722 RepID=UPI00048F4140|nr:hypothetical protein [Citromicrobium sp. JLT1363]
MILSALRNLFKGALLALLNSPLILLLTADVDIAWKIGGTIAFLGIAFGIGMMISTFKSNRRSGRLQS